jgi:hypothetical protein
VIYKQSLFFHAKALHGFLPRFQAKANMNLGTFRLEVKARGRYYWMTPQFLYRGAGGMRYAPQIAGDAVGFVGWLPYFNKRWPIAVAKLPFKQFCDERGLATPRYWTAGSEPGADFIIKHPSSSFGRGIRGPFKTKAQSGEDAGRHEHEYCEQFIEGRIAKIWYWNDRPVCLELKSMPRVTGDGVRTLFELIAARAPHPSAPPERSQFAALARYQELALDAVLPAGQTALADFLYNSPLFPLSAQNSNVLTDYAGTAIGKQLAQSGPVFWSGIPEDLRAGTLYSVDAIVDDHDRVWFLEMNCNPMVHPDCYFAMLESMFGAAEDAAQAPPATMLVPDASYAPYASPPLAPSTGAQRWP